MCLFIFFWDDPGFNAVEDHVVDGHSVSQMDWFLNTQDAKDFKLDRCEVVEHVVELEILFCVLDALVYGDDKLVCLFYCKLSFCINNGKNSWLNELLLKEIEILEVILTVDEIVLQWCDWTFHVENTSLFTLKSHGTDGHEMSHNCFCSDSA